MSLAFHRGQTFMRHVPGFRNSIAAVAFTAIMASGSAFSASVRYGDAFLDGYGKIDLYHASSIGGGDYWICFAQSRIDNPLLIQCATYYDYDLQYLLTAVKAESGDIVRREYFDSQSEYFVKEVIAEGTPAVKQPSVFSELLIDPSQSTYLAYMINDATLGDIYGWVELGAVNDKVAVLNSAIDLGGGQLPVGPVPEPNSSLLFLLGLAGMILRRPNMLRDV